MPTPHLGIDDEDFCLDILPRIEQSFGFTFGETDLKEVVTFGQLCAATQAKLTGEIHSDCTTQQAFYKARHAIQKYTQIDSIQLDTNLASVLPTGQQRRKVVMAIEQELGMKLELLHLSPTAQAIGTLLVVSCFIWMFFDLALGVVGLTAIICGLRLAAKLSNRVISITMRELAERMSARYYRASRRNPDAVNPQEVVGRMQRLFSQYFGLKLHQLTMDAVLF